MAREASHCASARLNAPQERILRSEGFYDKQEWLTANEKKWPTRDANE